MKYCLICEEAYESGKCPTCQSSAASVIIGGIKVYSMQSKSEGGLTYGLKYQAVDENNAPLPIIETALASSDRSRQAAIRDINAGMLKAGYISLKLEYEEDSDESNNSNSPTD